ncbi:MAG: hypothetical protein IJB33_06195 [Akkermansia sp.]|nr:hypothetical protein [Akkermansia sp.]
MYKKLKKIFGLFAMAAVAATGLTCCGGGGGDDGELSVRFLCNKVLMIQAPGPLYDPDEEEEGEADDDDDEKDNIITGEGNAFAGSMFVEVMDMESSAKAPARISFGRVNNGRYAGYVEIVGGTPEAPQITVYAQPGSDLGKDEEVWAWFSSFLDEDIEEGDTIVGMPAPYITLDNWTSRESGTCTVRFTIGKLQAYCTGVSFDLKER